ncbi:MAG: O-antigen ligase family protein [Clostridia bacterium]|nr:O-antigen ligase family protein [Clostridia bacterium]
MELFKNKANAFLNGCFYPLLIFFVTLISHTFSLELFGVTIIFITVSLGLIICDNLKFLISPLIMFILTFSQKSIEDGRFFQKPYLIAMICFAIYFIALFIVHFIIHKKSVNIKSFTKSKLFLGYVLLCGSFLLNGILNFNEYDVRNLTFALILILSIGVVFFIFSINLCNDDNIKNYLFYTLYLVSVLITFQLFLAFVSQIQIENGEIIKESIMLGWGMWNNVGGMLAMLLPIHFYFASTVKKFGIIFYLSGMVSFLAIVLTLSRSSLLVSCLIIVISAIACCFYGNNKKICRIVTAIVFVIGVLGIIVFWNKISSILGDYIARGFDDNGRFDIYKRGFENFLQNPIFGGGFYSVDAQDHTFAFFLPDRYHNTIIQMMGACGIVGLLAYIFHRYQVIKMLWCKRSLYTFFACLCISALLLTSMLDNHFFNFYPTFVYSILLSVINNTKNEADTN